MGTKRPADVIDTSGSRVPPQNTKKLKPLLPWPPLDNDSSQPSSGSVSVDSALQSSAPASEDSRNSSTSSVPQTASESRDEPSTEPSSGKDKDLAQKGQKGAKKAQASRKGPKKAQMPIIGGPKKPYMRFKEPGRAALLDLHSRLEKMLLQFADANEELEEDPDAYNMENVDEDQPHIEMNLGLGVLEQSKGDTSSSGSESGSDDGKEVDDEPEKEKETDDPTPRTLPRKEPKSTVMDKLRGVDPVQRKANIQVLS